MVIDGSGNIVTVVPYGILQVLPVGDAMFAYGHLTSTDQGNTWSVIPGNTNSIRALNPGLDFLYIMQGYTTIDGRRVMHTAYTIHAIDQTPAGTLDRTDLDLSGLDGNTILNLHEWQGQVFAVTQTGVYTRSVSDFFTKQQ